MSDKHTRVALRTIVLYAFFACLWMVLSRLALPALAHDVGVIEKIVIYKGWAFVAATGFLLYFSLRRQMQWLKKESGSKLKAEQLVRESEESLRVLVDAIPHPAFLMDRDGTAIVTNIALASSLGRDGDNLTGKSLFHLDSQGFTEQRKAYAREIVESAKPVIFEDSRAGRDFINYMYPVLDCAGAVSRIAVFALDITKRKRAEAQLAESEERYRIAIEHSNDGVALVKGDIPIFVNQKLLEIFGYESREEIAGKDLYIAVHPDDREMVAAYSAKWQRGEPAPSRLEFKGIKRDGTTIFAEISMAMTVYQGEPTGLVYVRDTTERKVAEEALRQTEERYRDIFEHSLEGIFQITPQQTFVTANPAYARIFGYESTEELMAKAKSNAGGSYVHGEDYQQFVRLLEERGFVEGYERQRLRKDGAKIWVRSNIRAVRNAAGEVLYFEGTVQDVTARREAEEALLASQLKLSEAMDLTRIVYWEVDLTTDDFVFNDPFYAVYGTTAEAEGGYRMAREEYGRRFVHPNDMWIFRQLGEKRLASTEREFVQDAEHRIVRRDGHVRYVTVRIHASRDASGRVIRYYGTNQDITERRKAEEKLESTLENLRKAIGGTIQTIVQVVEMRDPYTAGHQRRVADLARSIATAMGLPSDVIEGIRIAAVIHDIGKVAVPAEILSKPGKLTQNELELIKDHAVTGYDILKHVEFPWPIAEIVYQHHERLDGSGYPRGLKGDSVLLEARIIALADVVEAIASHRPFRPARGVDAALDEIEEHRGTRYDPEVVDTCLKLFREKGYVLTDEDDLPPSTSPWPASDSRVRPFRRDSTSP